MTKANDPINANAFDPQLHAKGGISSERISEINNGLTKREFFAAMAMQGIFTSGWNVYEYDEASKCSVKAADALITALNQSK